jgi:hypothetical protein
MINDANHKNTKNNGIDNIFNTGFIVTFINHNIIHQIIYVFNHHATAIQGSIVEFHANRYVIKYSINALNSIEKRILILINFNKYYL